MGHSPVETREIPAGKGLTVFSEKRVKKGVVGSFGHGWSSNLLNGITVLSSTQKGREQALTAYPGGQNEKAVGFHDCSPTAIVLCYSAFLTS
jgi:hypothetical protein